jgi:hypothetical protein
MAIPNYFWLFLVISPYATFGYSKLFLAIDKENDKKEKGTIGEEEEVRNSDLQESQIVARGTKSHYTKNGNDIEGDKKLGDEEMETIWENEVMYRLKLSLSFEDRFSLK